MDEYYLKFKTSKIGFFDSYEFRAIDVTIEDTKRVAYRDLKQGLKLPCPWAIPIEWNDDNYDRYSIPHEISFYPDNLDHLMILKMIFGNELKKKEYND